MSETHKRLIAGGVIAILLGSLIWGSYLPYRKSKLYVQAISAGNNAKSFEEFMTPYLKALNAPSPIGQEELVRNFTQTISGLVGDIKNPSVDTGAVVSALGTVLDQYGRPVLERRSGTSQVQTYTVFAGAYLRIFEVINEKLYRNGAVDLLEKGLDLSPTRPQVLYLLFEYEQTYGTNEEAIVYGERIMQLWPDDERTERTLKQLKNR